MPTVSPPVNTFVIVHTQERDICVLAYKLQLTDAEHKYATLLFSECLKKKHILL